MRYVITFYNKRVQQTIFAWPTRIRADFLQIARRIESEGPHLGLPHTRAMGHGLFEIRARGAEGIGRAMFGTQIGRRIVILTAFIKKTQQTPASELTLARKRLKEINRE